MSAVRTTQSIADRPMARCSVWVVLVAALLSVVPARGAPIEGEFWFPLGPAPIENFFGGGVSGRASAIAVNPQNVEHVWVGGAAGGVWRSVNGGRNWVPISDGEVALAIGAIAVDDCDVSGCDTIYAGTGENAIRRDTYYGRGLLLFDSVGEFPSWTLRTGAPFDFMLGSINDVVLDPTTSGATKRIFVTLSSGTTSSASQATVTAPPPPSGGFGIYRSDDKGITWTKLVIPGADGARPTALEMHPDDHQILYAGFLGTGVFKTTDGGDTWCPLNEGVSRPAGCPNANGLDPNVAGGFDHVEIAIHRSDPDVVYATFGHCADRLIQACTPSVFRTGNAGQNWTKQRQGTTSGSAVSCPTIYSRYTHALAVDPLLSNVLLIGGTRLCRSTDGGATFLPSDANLSPGGSPWGPIIHLDHREILFHPADDDRVFSTDDGGFAYSLDGGANWTPGNRDLQLTGFYSLTSAPNTSRVLGGAQDNSGQLWKGFRAWDHVGDGDGGYAVIDLDDPMKLYLGGNFGALTRSTNGGLSFIGASPPGTSESDRAFNVPIVQDRTGSHRLYYGADRLFCSTDDGFSWTQVSPVLAPGATDEITPLKNVITAIGVNGSRIYVGYYGGQVFTNNTACNAGSTWTNVSAGLPSAPVTDIAVDPGVSEVAYLAFSGFGSGAHVFKTSTAGASWAASAAGLPAGVPVNALAIEPAEPSRVWAGLDSGPDPDRSNVYRSTEGGASWQPRNQGLPNAPVHDLSIDEQRLRIYAGLHGRGAYVLSQPIVGNYEGWVNGSIWDVPVFGQSFPENQACTMRLLQQTGDVCAASSTDAIGGAIRTDAGGVLGTDQGTVWNDKPVVWACLGGHCLAGTPIAECNDDENGDGVPDLLSTIVVDCGAAPGSAQILGCPSLTNPPGSLIEVGFFETGGGGAGPLSQTLAPTRGLEAAGPGTFYVMPILQSRESASRLCTVPVALEVGDDAAATIERARDEINADPSCVAAGVVAGLDDVTPEEQQEEDKFRRDPRLLLSGPTLSGAQIVAGIRVRPGEAGKGGCFAVTGLGNAMLDQLRIVRTSFLTSSGGASGGRLTFIERSGLGTCAVTLETTAGQSAGEVAQALVDLMLDASNPDPKPYCAEDENPRDVSRDGDGVINVFASSLQICLEDPGVGFVIVPEEIPSNEPPLCGNAQTSPAELWPPNHRLVPVSVTGVTDPDGDPISIIITSISQDEPLEGQGDGDTGPDGAGLGTSTAEVRAERSGTKKTPGDGRVYQIQFVAEDGLGGDCSGEVTACVPSEMSPGRSCVDQGARFDSTGAP